MITKINNDTVGKFEFKEYPTVKFKKTLPHAVTPTKADSGCAGFDLTATQISDYNVNYIEYDTGIALELPPNHVGLLFPRSSISKTSLSLANSVGVVDSSYRGSIKFRFKDHNNYNGIQQYSIGDRIGQLVIIQYPEIILQESDELSVTSRGDGGFGSTGR